MAKGKLFEYAVLYHPRATKEQRDAGESPKTEIVQEIKTILAESDKEVGIMAARALPRLIPDRTGGMLKSSSALSSPYFTTQCWAVG